MPDDMKDQHRDNSSANFSPSIDNIELKRDSEKQFKESFNKWRPENGFHDDGNKKVKDKKPVDNKDAFLKALANTVNNAAYQVFTTSPQLMLMYFSLSALGLEPTLVAVSVQVNAEVTSGGGYNLTPGSATLILKGDNSGTGDILYSIGPSFSIPQGTISGQISYYFLLGGNAKNVSIESLKGDTYSGSMTLGEGVVYGVSIGVMRSDPNLGGFITVVTGAFGVGAGAFPCWPSVSKTTSDNYK